MTQLEPDGAIADGVPSDNPGAREIAFAIPPRYNASRILFDNLVRGHGDRPALTGPGGARSMRNYARKPAAGATAFGRWD